MVSGRHGSRASEQGPSLRSIRLHRTTLRLLAPPFRVSGIRGSRTSEARPVGASPKAFREGFAAHVAASPEFRQAVKELQHTQNPRPAQKQVERGHVAADAEVEPAAAETAAGSEEPASEDAEEPTSETDAHDTIRGVPKMTYASGSSPLADAAAAAETAVVAAAEKPARRALWAIVVGAALVLIGGAVWLLMAGPAEVRVQGKPSASPVQSAGVTAVPTAGPGPSAVEPSADLTVRATPSVTVTTQPANTTSQSSTASTAITAEPTKLPTAAAPTASTTATPTTSAARTSWFKDKK